MIGQGQLVLLLSPRGKRYLRTVDPKAPLHTDDGKLDMNEIAAAEYGDTVKTHMGRPYRVLRPALYDLVKGVKRQTQILYPKDIGYIVMKLGIGPGMTVVEAGSGSGSMTVSLAWFVGENGKVHTHERRPEFEKLCRRNLNWAGLGDGRVEHHIRDVEAEGFAVSGADALFLDVREPQNVVAHIPAAVRSGSPVAFLVPTTNQVSDLLRALDKGPFQEIEVLELLVRRYKPVADRLRPDDRMVAHTGFLIFARCGADLAEEAAPEVDDAELPEEIGESLEHSAFLPGDTVESLPEPDPCAPYAPFDPACPQEDGELPPGPDASEPEGD